MIIHAYDLLAPILRKTKYSDFHFAGLSNRTRNSLKRSGIQFKWELEEKTDKELLMEIGIGVTTIKEIRKWLITSKRRKQ